MNFILQHCDAKEIALPEGIGMRIYRDEGNDIGNHTLVGIDGQARTDAEFPWAPALAILKAAADFVQGNPESKSPIAWEDPIAAAVSDENRIREVCMGNQDAMEFLYAFTHFCHFVDDAVDKDSEITPEVAAQVSLQWTLTLLFSEFAKKNAEGLASLFTQGWSAWVDSCRLEKHPDHRFRIGADVLKSFYGEVVFWTASKCGGYDHMRAMSRKYRAFNFEPDSKETND